MTKYIDARQTSPAAKRRPHKRCATASAAPPSRCTAAGRETADGLVRLWREANRVQQLHCDASRPAEQEWAKSPIADPEVTRAWEQLVDRLQPILKNMMVTSLRRFGKPPLDRDELLQEVYVRLLNNRAVVMDRCAAGSDAQLAVYLASVCDSVLLDQRRHLFAAKRGRDVTVPMPDGYDEKQPHPCDDVEALVFGRAKLRQFGRAVCRTAYRSTKRPERTCRIMHEVLVNGRRSRELGPELGMSPSSVNSVVSRMRRRLLDDGWRVAKQPNQ